MRCEVVKQQKKLDDIGLNLADKYLVLRINK